MTLPEPPDIEELFSPNCFFSFKKGIGSIEDKDVQQQNLYNNVKNPSILLEFERIEALEKTGINSGLIKEGGKPSASAATTEYDVEQDKQVDTMSQGYGYAEL